MMTEIFLNAREWILLLAEILGGLVAVAALVGPNPLMSLRTRLMEILPKVAVILRPPQALKPYVKPIITVVSDTLEGERAKGLDPDMVDHDWILRNILKYLVYQVMISLIARFFSILAGILFFDWSHIRSSSIGFYKCFIQLLTPAYGLLVTGVVLFLATPLLAAIWLTATLIKRLMSGIIGLISFLLIELFLHHVI